MTMALAELAAQDGGELSCSTSLRGVLATKQSSFSKIGAPGFWIASHIGRRVAPPDGSQ
jgi:hypothetical protein